MAILSILLTVIIIATSILMILIVLVQRPKQEGLGAAFGGGTLDSALGAHTTDILQKITTWLGIIFFVSAIGLAMVKTRQFSASAAQNPLEKVENREPEIPSLPPSLTAPGTEAPATTTPDTPEKAPATDAPKAADKAKEEAKPAPAKPSAPQADQPKADAGKAEEKAKPTPKADQPKAAPEAQPAPKAKPEQPKAAEKGAGKEN